MLPLDIQMQIDITAQAHKRELAEKFAELRERLLPEPEEPDLLSLFKAAREFHQAQMMQNMGMNNPYQQNALMASPLNLIGGALFGWRLF